VLEVLAEVGALEAQAEVGVLEVPVEGVALEVLAEVGVDGSRMYRDDPKVAVHRQDGSHQVGALVPPSAVVSVPNLAAALPLDPAQAGGKQEPVAVRTERTGDIAPEKTLGETTGDSGQLRAQLG